MAHFHDREVFFLPLFLFMSSVFTFCLDACTAVIRTEPLTAVAVTPLPRVPVFERWCSSEHSVLLIVSEDMSECSELCK